MENHGTVFAARHKRARETVEAMRTIWTQDVAQYHGDIIDFGPMNAWPKPVRKPYPPVYVGGAFPYSARRAVRYADGWLPQAARAGSYRQIGEMIPEFRRMAAEAGRDPASIAITVWHSRKDPDQIRRYADMGVERVVFALESEQADKVLPAADAIAEMMHKING